MAESKHPDHPMRGILTDEQIAESIRVGNELAAREAAEKSAGG